MHLEMPIHIGGKYLFCCELWFGRGVVQVWSGQAGLERRNAAVDVKRIWMRVVGLRCWWYCPKKAPIRKGPLKD